jgi:anthrone oxygenase-like protein
VRHAVELLGLISAGLFTGGALFAALVEHPARLEAGVPAALAQFRPSYRRATYLEGGAAALTLVLCVTATALGGSPLWLVGGLLVGVVIPLTVSLILPINRRILAARADGDEAEIGALLHRWGRLHELRTTLGVAGFVVLAFAAV